MVSKIFQTSLLLLSIILLFILKEAGAFRNIQTLNEGKERVQNSAAGLEDITTDLGNGISYISSHDRRSFSKNGMIFQVNLLNPNLELLPLLQSKLPFPFRPHGISLYHHSDGEKYLFVVNHEDEINSILRFKVAPKQLIFEKRFVHDLIQYPNDVAAIGLNSFYVSNDHTIPNNIRRFIGDFVIEKSGNIVFFQNDEAAVVTRNMAYANGINLSPDQKYLYVAATTENKLFIYKHSDELSPRVLLAAKYLGTGPDNIEIDKNGDLWIACHPHLLKYLAHAKDKRRKSPSEVLKISYKPASTDKFSQETIYLNDGKSISGGSVASHFVNDSIDVLLLGSVFEEKLVEINLRP